MNRAQRSGGVRSPLAVLLLLAGLTASVVAVGPASAPVPRAASASPPLGIVASSFHVAAKPLTVGLTANPHNLTLGETTLLNTSVSGGTLPYQYTWTVPSGCATVDSANLACKPNETGTFTIEVEVNDSSSVMRSGAANLTLVVTSASGGSSLFTEGTLFLFAGGIGVVAAAVTAVVIVSLWRRRSRRAPVAPVTDSPYVPPPGQPPP